MSEDTISRIFRCQFIVAAILPSTQRNPYMIKSRGASTLLCIGHCSSSELLNSWTDDVITTDSAAVGNSSRLFAREEEQNHEKVVIRMQSLWHWNQSKNKIMRICSSLLLELAILSYPERNSGTVAWKLDVMGWFRSIYLPFTVHFKAVWSCSSDSTTCSTKSHNCIIVQS